MKNWINKSKVLLASGLVFLFVVNPIFAAAPTTPSLPQAPKLPSVQTTTPTIPTIPVAPIAPGTKTDTTKVTPTTVTTPATSATTGSDTSAAPISGVVVVTGSATPGVDQSTTPVAANNIGTGANSDNSVGSGTGSKTNVSTNNNANVRNIIGGGASSGGNSSSFNTGNGTVKSGNANIILSILNFLNTSLVALPGGSIGAVFSQVMGNLIGNYIVDQNTGEAYSLTGSRLSATNTDTGANSTNNAVINTGNDNTVSDNNNALVGNNIDVSANTGGNQSSYNTGDGSVTSGNANVSLNLMNFVNSSIVAGNLGIFGVLNIFGNWVGNFVIPDQISGGLANLGIVLGNNNTGAGSTNNATSDISNSTDISNLNNAILGNNITATTNTGNNTSNFNTGNGAVSTGDSQVKLDVANSTNQNVVGDSAMLIMINVLGNWNGVPYAGPIIIASQDLINSGLLGSLLVGNSNTGANSTNNSTVTAGNTTNISNNNNANIGNHINLSANTGDNQSSYNTGSGSVSTGNANILANIMNFANYNIQASKVVMMVINVFGDWNGQLTNTDKTHATVATVTQSNTETTEAYVTGTFAGNVYIHQDPVSKTLSVVLKPNDSGQTQNITLLGASTNTPSSGVSAIGKVSGTNGFIGFMGKYGTYLFGFLLLIYFCGIGFSIYRKRLYSAQTTGNKVLTGRGKK